MSEHGWNCKGSKKLQRLQAAEELPWKGKEAVNHSAGEESKKQKEWSRKQAAAGGVEEGESSMKARAGLTGLACKGQAEQAAERWCGNSTLHLGSTHARMPGQLRATDESSI